MKEVVIGFDEPRYYIALAATLLFFGLVAIWVGKAHDSRSNSIIKGFGISFLFLILVNHPIMIWSENLGWHVHKALPLHLCSISFLLIGINSILRNRFIWMLTLFLGIVGGFHSLLTPQLSEGDSPYFYFFYYYKHGAILFFPLIQRLAWNFKLDKKDWMRTFVLANLYMLLSLGINWILNTWFPGTYVANYFYTWEPPKANNPIIQGEWPWYLIPCEIALLVHLVIIQLVFGQLDKKRERLKLRQI